MATAVARSPLDIVNATDLAEEMGLVNTRVRAQLLAFVEAELLEEVPRGPNELKRWYRRLNHPFWELCLTLEDAWK